MYPMFLATLLRLRKRVSDVKGAFLKFGDILRTLFVRPPTNLLILFPLLRGILWHFLRFSCGMTGAGSQGVTRIKTWMLPVAGLRIFHEDEQLYINHGAEEKITSSLLKSLRTS